MNEGIDSESQADLFPTVVYGVLGPSDGLAARAFLAAIPGSRSLISAPGIEARCVGAVESLPNGGFYWSPVLSAGAVPGSWREVSQTYGAAGIVNDRGSWTLFTDSLALHGVYVRRIGEAALFSTRLTPLVEVAGSLSPNWTAWATTLVTGSPLGSDSHFREITRLEAARGLEIDSMGAIRLVSYEPSWLIYPEVSPAASALVEVLREALPDRAPWQRPPVVTLSGGWDSRLLSALAVGRYRRKPEAWTTGEDDGRDRDLAIAPPVARRLRIRQHIVRQPDAGWPGEAMEARQRVQYETWMHTWLMPLARSMRRQVTDLLDGLAGDILVKGLFVDEELLSANVQTRTHQLFGRIGGEAERFGAGFRSYLAESITRSSLSRFVDLAGRFEGHMNQVALSILYTRTARAIALAPLRVFGPEIRCWFPYLDPSFLSYALAIDPLQKLEGRLSLELLRLGAPTVAQLPSTNDPGRKPPRTRHRLQASREAVDWMVDLILASEAASGLFEPATILDMRAGVYAETTPDFDRVKVLQAASLLAEWEIRYRDKLVSTRPEWDQL